MTRFLHTADLHLNAQRKNFSQRYLKRGAWALDTIENTARDHEVDCIVIAGDVFARPDLTIAERQLLSDWLGRLQTPVLMISGNHDIRQHRTIGNTCLSYLSSLKLHLHLIHDGAPKTVQAFGTCWLLLPYYRWTHLEFRLIVESMVWRVRRKQPEIPIVVVAHEAVQGATTDLGFEVTKSQQIKISADVDVQYWALGDVHSPQAILGNAYYCGPPYQTNFGELAEQKGCLIVDTDAPEKPEQLIFETPYPLVQLEEPPDKGTPWPEFAKFTALLPQGVRLPDHVLYEPPAQCQTEVSRTRARVPLFHGLQNNLEAQDLPDELVSRALGFADRMANDLGIATGAST